MIDPLRFNNSDANELHNRIPTERFCSTQAVVAGLLCALVLWCGTLAANEQWHQWFHDGNDEVSPTCAVCLFATGGCDQPPIDPPQLTIPLGLVVELVTPTVPRLPAVFRDNFRSRGPPSLRR